MNSIFFNLINVGKKVFSFAHEKGLGHMFQK